MNESPPTIAQALGWAAEYLRASSPTARLDAELLLAYVLGWGRARLLAEGRWPLDQQQESAFHSLVARRAALEPVAYLIGHKEFYGLDFAVDSSVLVPRPETELLVERTLERLKVRTFERLVVVDVGTGSGAIAVALAVHLPVARIIAIDISPAALELARRNVERHGLAGRVRLLQGDLLDPLDQPVDLIVSNPPYTILSEIDAGVRRHEPRLALDGGPDGLELYRRLLAAAPTKLRPDGAVLLEIGATQAAAVAELARRAFPEAWVSVHQDLAGRDRVVVVDDAETRRPGDKENGS
jgi:release factor glutamine methyltransferase